MFLDTSMYLCCQIYLYEFRYNHSTFVDLLDCCRDKEKGLVTQSSVAQYKIKREDCSPLFSFSVATKFTYLNYIMNFSKVNVRDSKCPRLSKNNLNKLIKILDPHYLNYNFENFYSLLQKKRSSPFFVVYLLQNLLSYHRVVVLLKYLLVYDY